MSRALDILETLETRLAAILVAGGYNTNAGQTVRLGESILDADVAVPSLALYEGRPSREGYGWVENTSERPEIGARMSPEYTVEGLVAIGASTPIAAAHGLIADIKKALWGQHDCGELSGARDHAFVGHATFLKQSGSNRVAVAVVGKYTYVENFAAP